MPIIPARKGVAFSVKAGQEVKIINTFGKQVLDFWAFNPSDPNGFLSMCHTRGLTRKVALTRGDKLYSTRRKPMITLTEDNTLGVHDMIFPACDAERYRMLGFDGYHANCSDNLHNVSSPFLASFGRCCISKLVCVTCGTLRQLILLSFTAGVEGKFPRLSNCR